MLIDRTVLELIVRTYEDGTISAAARALNISPSLAARKIAQAEADVGARFFVRTAKKSHVTEAGLILVEWAQSTLAEEAQMRDRLMALKEELSGTIRFACPEFLALNFLPGWLADFQYRHPGINIEVSAVDRPVHVADERYDIALQLGPDPHGSLIGRKLYDLPMRLYCSPLYIQRYGFPTTIEDLKNHRFVRHNWFNSETLHLMHDDGHREELLPERTFVASSGVMAIEMVMQGIGIATVARRTMELPQFNGKVVALMPEYRSVMPSGDDWGLWLVLPERRSTQRVQVFSRELLAHMQRTVPVV